MKAWYGMEDEYNVQPDNLKSKVKRCSLTMCTFHAVRIAHELSFNFISELDNIKYASIIIVINIRNSWYEVCSVEYGFNILLSISHRAFPYHTTRRDRDETVRSNKCVIQKPQVLTFPAAEG